MNNKNLFSLLLVWTLLFPYVGWFSGIDTQPLFILFSSVFIILNISNVSKNPLNIWFLISCIFCFLSIIISQLVYLESFDFIYLITYVVVVITIFNIKLLLDLGEIEVNKNHIYIALLVYVLVGFIQSFIPDFLAFMVSRSIESVYTFAETGRGVRSLSAEPATLGKLFNYFYVLLIVMYFKSGNISFNKISSLTILFLIIHVLIPRSAYALMTFLIIAMSLFAVIKVRYFILTSLLLFLTFSIFYSSTEVTSGGRIITLIHNLIHNPELLLEQGAMRRLLNIPISLYNLGYYGFVGSGSSASTWITSMPTPIGDLNYLVHSRNLGGFIEFILVLGVLSLPFVSIYSYYFFSIFKVKSKIADNTIYLGIWLFIVFFLLILQDGAVTLPLAWFFIFYINKICKGFNINE
tara:strand:- start:3179 stop:4402 length:1224 start_codon:yes stop_codon:yes gene_type:complete